MSRTLAEALRERSAESLADLLAARPDLTQPVPHDLSEVAARLTTRASVRRCLDHLDAWRRALVETLSALAEPSSAEAVAELLAASHGRPQEPGFTLADVESGMSGLADLALVWLSDRGWRVPRAVLEEFGAHPLGLAPAESNGTTGNQNPGAPSLTELPADQDRILRRLAAGPPVGTIRQLEPDSPVGRLVAAGLLRQLDAQTVQIPRPTALTLRAEAPTTPPAPRPPEYSAPGRRPTVADQAGLGTAVETIGDVEAVLDELDHEQPTLLRDGGIGVRDLNRIARHINRDRTRTGFVLELTRSTGLTSTVGGRSQLTTAADQWLSSSLAERWARLVRGWLTSRTWWPSAEAADRHPWADPDPEHHPLRLRRWFVDLLAGQVHNGVDIDQLGPIIAWHRPNLARDLELLPHLAREADWLGLSGMGTVTDLLPMALSGGAEEVAQAAAGTFPEPLSQVIVQADLTAVAPGPLAHEVGRMLRQIATVESRGGATVFRFTRQSAQRAFDAGWTSADLISWISSHSSTEVPQPLHFLIGDVARRHGQIKVGTTSCWVTLDDPAQLALALGDAGAQALGVTRIADTVLVADAEPDEVVGWLRRLGLAPATDMVQPKPHRAPAPTSGESNSQPEPGPLADHLLRRARGAERAASIPHRLRRARDEVIRVEVSYVAADGSRRHTEAVPAQVSDGSVRLVGSGAELSIPLSRVLAVHDVT